MKGEALNFRRSNISGAKVDTLALDSSNCSAAVHLRVCSAWKQRPGIRSGVPDMTSAADIAMSSLAALLMPSRTQGSDHVHDLLACTAQCRESLRVRWNRSTMSFSCGCYEVVAVTLMPNLDRDLLQAFEVNWAPLSVVTVAGTLNHDTHESMNAWITVSAVASAMGTASGHRVVRSTKVTRYLNPLSEGNGPTMSRWTCSKRAAGTGIGNTGGLVCTETLLLWHTWHCFAHSNTSRLMLGHTYIFDMIANVAFPDGCASPWIASKIDLRRTCWTSTLCLPFDTSHTTRRATPGKSAHFNSREEGGSSERGRWSCTNASRSTSDSVYATECMREDTTSSSYCLVSTSATTFSRPGTWAMSVAN